MVLFVGAHRPDRKPVFRVFGFPGFPVFRVFRCSGRSAGRVCRTTGDSESRFAAFPVPVPIPVSVPVSAAAAGRSCSSGPLRPPMHLARLRVLSAIRPRGASDAHFGLRPLTFYFGCRPGTVCRFRRGVSPVFLPPGAVSGCRRCPRSGGAACASGACRRSSAPPLQARSPGRARAWRSTTARRRSP